MTLLPMAIYWVFALWGVFSHRPILLYVLTVSSAFGAMAVVPTNLTGGLTFTPLTMSAMLICVREFLLFRNGLSKLFRLTTSSRSGLILLLYWLVALVVTLFAPRFFQGEIEVVPMRVLGFMMTDWLRPTTQNISQMAYFTISIFSLFAFTIMMGKPGMLRHLTQAWMAGAIALIVTGGLDWLTSYMPIEPLLAPFRSATYALLTDVSVADGAKRVVGLMPEASSYGMVCAQFLAVLIFLRLYLPEEHARARAKWLTVGLFCCTVLSTSSAAYVGLGVLAAAVGLEWMWRTMRQHNSRIRRSVLSDLNVAIVAGLFLCAVVIFLPRVLDPVVERVQSMVFEKVETDSFAERSMWTRVSVEAGFSSYLIGVGVGSTRASNSIAAIFSNTGIVGLLLYCIFLARMFISRLPAQLQPTERAFASALRWGYLPVFIIGVLIGTSSFFGSIEALRMGFLLSLFQMKGVRISGHQESGMATPRVMSLR
jgi:hypothetical protein